MKKKFILIVLAAVALLSMADNSFARGGSRYPGRGCGYSRGGFGHRGFRFGPHRRRWPIIYRRGGIRICPTIVFGSCQTKVVEKTVVVWITNDNGSKTQVKLTVAGDGGYIGSNGEYYSTMPTEQQLKAVYGLDCTPAESSIMVWFENDDGAEIVIVLTKDGDEYVGPKGERYQGMPDIKQLREVYGK